MNYQHSFHAGNFADVFKHVILVFCLEEIHKKSGDFLAIDTHSGAGKYSILDPKSLKTKELENGIKKILRHPNFLQILPENYLRILAKINLCTTSELPDRLRFYFGSPQIIKNFLRNSDKAVFSEINPQIFYQLKREFSGNRKIFYTQQDGLQILESNLLQAKNTGLTQALVIIDPAYEKMHNKVSLDYQKSFEALENICQKMTDATYLLWYPIIEGEEIFLKNFYKKISQLKFQKISQIITDVGFEKNNPKKFHACGMFIFNGSKQVDEKIKNYFPKILEVLKCGGNGVFTIENLR